VKWKAVELQQLSCRSLSSASAELAAFRKEADLNGHVKWFSDQKGYGFIETEQGDVFVHYSSIEGQGRRTLVQGQEVDVEVQQGPKGLSAKKVKII
jgi:CspA family cold shock protein